MCIYERIICAKRREMKTLIERLGNHYYVSGTTDTDQLIDDTIAHVKALEAALRVTWGWNDDPEDVEPAFRAQVESLFAQSETEPKS